MRIAIMQPYFLPYYGYFQLMSAVDRFVILDDVNYIKRGWINRNRIPANKLNSKCEYQWLTVPVKDASQNRLISDTTISPCDRWKRKMWLTIQHVYGHGNCADDLTTRIHRWLTEASGSLSRFLTKTICEVASLCGIDTEVIPTSSIYPRHQLRGAARIMDICRREKAHTYVNLPGGRHLYNEAEFCSAGIQLQFLEPKLPTNIKHSGDGSHVFSMLDQLLLNSPQTLPEIVRMNNIHIKKAAVAPAA